MPGGVPLSRDFFLARAEISFNDFFRLTSKAKRKYIVLTRTVEGRVYHYVFLRKALEEAFKRFRPDPNVPTGIALNLHEHDSNPSIDLRGEPSSWIDAMHVHEVARNISVLTSGGSVVGVFDPVANRPDATYEVKGFNFVYPQSPLAAKGGGQRRRGSTRRGETKR